VILPAAALALPICTQILSGSMRDTTGELYEALAMDGASPARALCRLVLPLSTGGMSTIAAPVPLHTGQKKFLAIGRWGLHGSKHT